MTSPMTGPMIQLENVSKIFGSFAALTRVSLDIRTGEFFSLLGPSGCGKTTLLRAIAGFEDPSTGEIFIDGRAMSGVPANDRPTNMVFQNYAIFPHLNVAQNVAYGLRRLRLKKSETAKRVASILEVVGLAGFQARDTQSLSGGQRQRVALARALILQPKVLLLDEPLSALDKKLREQMQTELRQLQRSLGITFIMVTHDQEEALIMSDRVAVMFDGELVQLATPQELYRRPINKKVAEFIGTMNFFDTRLIAQKGESVELEIAGLGCVEIAGSQALANPSSSSVVAGIRPEMMTLLFDSEASGGQETSGTVVGLSYYGDITYYDVEVAGKNTPMTISMKNSVGRNILEIGDPARIGWGADAVILLD